MPTIRILEIGGFRGIKKLRWLPNPGLNVLIGPGDSCKTTILEAIDWCLGMRRTLPATLADFNGMNAEVPIKVIATIGNLPPELLSISKFGECLRGFAKEVDELEPEPGVGLESVLQVVLKIEGDLEPQWYIRKAVDDDDDVVRLPWEIKRLLAPLRIGTSAARHLTWHRGSALSKLTDGEISAYDVLSTALHNARNAFANSPPTELADAIKFAADSCKEFAVANIEEIKAGLDIDAVTAGEACIALHDQDGVPLRRMGVGSVRLLSSALLSGVANNTVVLVDELEYGLEPHRVVRLLHSLGSKQESAQKQVFVTTHSPVAISELKTSQIWMVRERGGLLELSQPLAELQGTVRTYPNALLSRKVFVCEGASEVGIMRGLDRYANESNGSKRLPGGLLLHGIALVDGRGSSAPANALALRKLGFPVALLRDSDVVKKKPKDGKKWDAAAIAEAEFVKLNGRVFCWDEGFHTEAVVFKYATVGDIKKMLVYAKEFWGEDTIADHTSRFCQNSSLEDIERELGSNTASEKLRQNLGIAANKGSWFKRIDHFETVTNEILLPSISNAEIGHKYLRRFFLEMLDWCSAPV